MGKPLFIKRPSFLLAWTLVFSVLFTAIVYACSGLASMQMSSLHASHAFMDGEMGDKNPCGERKQDICQSVRYRMLSIQSSSYQAGTSLYVSTLPQDASIERFLLPDASHAYLPSAIVFNPLFKRSLVYSDLVLRI